MTDRRIIVDRSFESLLAGLNGSWILSSGTEEVGETVRAWSCDRAILPHRFSRALEALPMLPPLVLVFEREGRPPALERVLPLLGRVDMVIPRKVLESDLGEILSKPPYLSRWSESWVGYYPKGLRGFLSKYRSLLVTRERVDRRHWRVFQEWAEDSGSVSDVARSMNRHPKTVRHSLGMVSDQLGVGRIDQFSRESLREMLRLVDFPGDWQEEQK